MSRGENGHHDWTGDLQQFGRNGGYPEEPQCQGMTAEDLVRETVNNFESLDGVDAVEWVAQSPYATFHELIRVRTHRGKIIRLSIAYVEDEEGEEAFDDCFQ